MCGRTVLALVLVGVVVASANAANVLSVPDTAVDADEFDLVLPIELESDQALTRLRFDLGYDPAFCDRLDDPEGIELSGAGRATVDPDDTIAITCADGSIRIDLQDDTGAVVVPAGVGEVVEVDFGALVGAAAAAVTFTPTNVLARAGGTNVRLTVLPGVLTIRAVATTTTTSPSGSTVSTTTTTSVFPGTSSTDTSTTTATTAPGPTATTTPAPGAPTTTTVPPRRCDGDTATKPSFAAVHCALDALLTRTDAEVVGGQLPSGLGALVRRIPGAIDGAEARCAQANTRRARAGIRSAMRTAGAFRHRLVRSRLADEVRSPLQDAASAFLFEARFLRGFLACPMS